MPRRGENIRKRKDGRWEGRYKSRNNYTKECRYVSVYGKTYAEVKAKLKSAQDAAPARPLPPRCFRDLLAEWLASRRPEWKPSTLRRYDFLIQRHILPELGPVLLEHLDAGVINGFLARKQTGGGLADDRGLSPAYVRSMAVVVQSALRYGADRGLCQPMAGKVCKPAPEKAEIRILTQPEQQALEQSIYARPDATGLGVFLALYGGLRVGEVCALGWQDVDLEQGLLRIRHTVTRVNAREGQHTDLVLGSPKTAASIRTVPIHRAVLPLLKAAFSAARSPYVIADTDAFVNPRTFTYRYHRLLERAGLPPIHFHALRHTFATRCIAAGVDMKTLSELMGHASITVTMNTYVHSSLETKQQQLAKLESVLLPIWGQNAGHPAW